MPRKILNKKIKFQVTCKKINKPIHIFITLILLAIFKLSINLSLDVYSPPLFNRENFTVMQLKQFFLLVLLIQLNAITPVIAMEEESLDEEQKNELATINFVTYKENTYKIQQINGTVQVDNALKKLMHNVSSYNKDDNHEINFSLISHQDWLTYIDPSLEPLLAMIKAKNNSKELAKHKKAISQKLHGLKTYKENIRQLIVADILGIKILTKLAMNPILDKLMQHNINLKMIDALQESRLPEHLRTLITEKLMLRARTLLMRLGKDELLQLHESNIQTPYSLINSDQIAIVTNQKVNKSPLKKVANLDPKLVLSSNHLYTDFLNIWDIKSKRYEALSEKLDVPITNLICSQNGNIFAAICNENTVKLWTPKAKNFLLWQTGKKLVNFLDCKNQSKILEFKLNQNGTLIACRLATNEVNLWCTDKEEPIAKFNNVGVLTCIALNPEGNLLAIASKDKLIMYDIINKVEKTIDLPKDTLIDRLAFNTNTTLLAARFGNSISLLRIPAYTELNATIESDNKLGDICFISESDLFYTEQKIQHGDLARIANVTTNECIYLSDPKHNPAKTTVKINSDNKSFTKIGTYGDLAITNFLPYFIPLTIQQAALIVLIDAQKKWHIKNTLYGDIHQTLPHEVKKIIEPYVKI